MPSERVLGKRKRKVAEKVEKDTDSTALEDAQAIFRRHFEAQFAPLEEETKAKLDKDGKSDKSKAGADTEDGNGDGVEDMRSDSESEDDGEWDGLSGEDSSNDDESDEEGEDSEADSDPEPKGVEIVDYSKPASAAATALQTAMMSKREMRAYLSPRPPDTTSTDVTRTKQKASGDDDDPHNEDSKTLLANDLALQRLISESHILSASNPFNAIGSSAAAAEGSKSFTEGRTRKLTTDLRLQKLGSKSSIFTQQKMPMGMRKGINTAKQEREAKRRREAKENGIILETAQKKGGKRKSKGRGGVAVDMPGMGKFRNGELRLSTREVKAVEMEGKRFDVGGKKRRRRR
ncbi:pre-rRNA processing and 40S ribosomal subunit assembly [Gnomoniopsis smithogilvyi]|uniref:Pre-rRNA processing and 40S ribosomal subunit assembly n=1 Tax=Gnomoniopsis smithogilvyi TaxID=1191159 RepID=A0A9W8YUL1_9PEZI|nr:pre-rRNA processing and 40S ribosomal subunit assembly [Gnomoniopsis smithogilvyi]